jgi:hypothetical protein
MNTDNDFFAPPPFQAAEGLARLKRELRALGLNEREGRFERRGQDIARAAVDGPALKAGIVKQPGRSPEWQERSLKSGADLREFVADLKKRLARWSDSHD